VQVIQSFSDRQIYLSYHAIDDYGEHAADLQYFVTPQESDMSHKDLILQAFARPIYTAGKEVDFSTK